MYKVPSKLIVDVVRDYYGTSDFIPLHAPVFNGNESKYVNDTINSTFVSSVGEYVSKFESQIASYTSCESAVATVNGTAALHICLLLAGVEEGDLVLTQAFTFVATCNAIRYCGADPIFIDIDRSTLGMSPEALNNWLEQNAVLNSSGQCIDRYSGRKIKVCLPMHTFGHPVDLDGILSVSSKWNLAVVEDAAESLGSFYKGRHTGSFGLLSSLSFNGNKIITTGGGGMVLTNQVLAAKAKHITTTAKRPHNYEYYHDDLGYNYRLPNINAALGVAQMDQLDGFLKIKRSLAKMYKESFKGSDIEFIDEPDNCYSNFWLNAVLCPEKKVRDQVLKETNEKGVMTRPVWQLMTDLPMYANCKRGVLDTSKYVADRLVNLPSSVRLNKQ